MTLDGHTALAAGISFLIAGVPVFLFVVAITVLMKSTAGRYTTRLLMLIVTTGCGHGIFAAANYSASGTAPGSLNMVDFLGFTVELQDPALISDMFFGCYLALVTAFVISYAKKVFVEQQERSESEWPRA
ncbi:MAG: hypothetical protein ACR2PM_18320 [Hyphomicrobiales bacterium]